MLNTLAGYSDTEAQQMLSLVTQYLVPQAPDTLVPDLSPGTELLVRSIVGEIREEVGIEDGDASVLATGRILERVASEFAGLTLKDKDVKEIGNHLGQRGALPIEMYDWVIDPAKYVGDGVMDLPEGAVREAIVHSDLYEHIRPTDEGPFGFPAISIFVKKRLSSSVHPSGLIVLTYRRGRTQQLIDVWRFFHDEVNFDESASAWECFLKFLAVFGSPMRIGPSASRLCFVDYRVRLRGRITRVNVEMSHREGYYYILLNTNKKGDHAQIGMAYGVYRYKYIESLIAHGVRQVEDGDLPGKFETSVISFDIPSGPPNNPEPTPFKFYSTSDTKK